MLGICFMALIKEGTLVAAWKRGGYCAVSMSPSSEFVYFGRESADTIDVCGVYKNVISWPDSG